MQTLEQEVAGLHQQYGAGLLRFAMAFAGFPDAARDAVQGLFRHHEPDSITRR